MPATRTIRLGAWVVAASAMPWAAFGMSVTLTPSTPSPVPVGTVITFTARVAEAESGTLWYRFRSRTVGEDLHMIEDFGGENQLDWAAIHHEGVYEIQVDVRNLSTGGTASAKAEIEVRSLVSAGQPVIKPTAHPLVFLYSAPACADGARMKVQFKRAGGIVQNTPYQACTAGLSMNYYLGGLRAQTQYSVHHVVDTGSALQDGPTLALTTPAAGAEFVDRTLLMAAPTPIQDEVLLQATTASNPMATDLNGNVIWYYPGTLDFNQVGPFILTSPDRGGYFWGTIQNVMGDQSQQLVREFDLTGRTVLQTNAARVSEQLVAMGKRPIGSFHHEARRLKDGKIAVLATVEQILTDVQGPGAVDVLGAMIVILNRNMEVVWAWDGFDHLDATRMATLGEICPFGGCPPVYLAARANDWLHANAISEAPDGNLLLSCRSQDWVVKIDYQNGAGSGDVIWRLGKDGDFSIDSSELSAWFSHQHDPKLLADNSTLILFDNGNLRILGDPSARSRGQAIQLDEQNRVAHLRLNADLGGFAGALGSAEQLPNGDYHFNVGVLPGSISMAIEVNAAGQPVYQLSVAAPVYRSFRMRDLYTPE